MCHNLCSTEKAHLKEFIEKSESNASEIFREMFPPGHFYNHHQFVHDLIVTTSIRGYKCFVISKKYFMIIHLLQILTFLHPRKRYFLKITEIVKLHYIVLPVSKDSVYSVHSTSQ